MLASWILPLVTHYTAVWQTFVGWNDIEIPQGEVQDAAHTLLPNLAFSKHWHVLGPFQIGTRGRPIYMPLSSIMKDATNLHS